ncbi:hypothetical protein E2C01_009638 [Portunus trituberculatus]|uniref:Uncharacterized protein n=1 Tax=Portunus trituberculatus TaxID=210409 RepID=A0A5B7D6A6_PORTR|nr:hypothetical protein [Portunus trituberculatus]
MHSENCVREWVADPCIVYVDLLEELTPVTPDLNFHILVACGGSQHHVQGYLRDVREEWKEAGTRHTTHEPPSYSVRDSAFCLSTAFTLLALGCTFSALGNGYHLLTPVSLSLGPCGR